MGTLQDVAQRTHRRFTLPSEVSSEAEREILTLLRRPASHPPSLDDIREELLASFSELQIQNAITGLLEKEAIETIYSPRFKLGFVLTSKTEE